MKLFLNTIFILVLYCCQLKAANSFTLKFDTLPIGRNLIKNASIIGQKISADFKIDDVYFDKKNEILIFKHLVKCNTFNPSMDKGVLLAFDLKTKQTIWEHKFKLSYLNINFLDSLTCLTNSNGAYYLNNKTGVTTINNEAKIKIRFFNTRNKHNFRVRK